MSFISSRGLESQLKWKWLILVWSWNVWQAVASSLIEMGISNKIHSVVTSKWAFWKPTLETLWNLKWWKWKFENWTSLDEMKRDLEREWLSPIIIDVSTNPNPDFHHDLLNQWLTIVTANKVPAAMLEAEKAFQLINQINYWYDATLMAWQWALARLKETKEEVDDWLLKLLSIECICSWTLARILKEVAKWMPFSEAVIMVMELWFTESDPMNDLDWMDVAKKLVIIARTLWYAVNIEDVEVKWVLNNRFRKVFLDIKTQVEVEFAWQCLSEDTHKKEIRKRFALYIKEAWIDEHYRILLLNNSWKVPRYVATITFDENWIPKLKAWIQFVDPASEMWVAESNKLVVRIDRWWDENDNHFIIWWNWAWPRETASWVLRDLMRVLRR